MKTIRLLTAVASLLFAFRSLAVGTFISAPNRVDVVYDDARGLLYISSGIDVLRYDLGSDSFLSPFHVGGSLMGMDLSPDGNTLAVADASSGGGSNWVHFIDLPTGVIREAYFALDSIETGTFSVAYGNDSALMISSQFAGSGWVPMRRYDPASGTVTTVGSIRHNSMLCPSGDGSVVGVAEADISGGETDRYSVSSHSIAQQAFANTFLYEIGVNRNGTQLAVPNAGGCTVFELAGASLAKTNVIGLSGAGRPVGVVFHPSKDAVFFTWSGTSEVRAYQTVSWSELARYDFQSTFTATNNAYYTGRMKISRDGAILFATVTGGVRYFRHNLVIPDYDYNHRLVVGSSPAGLGTATPLPFGTNWVQSIPAPTLTNQIDDVVTNGGSRFRCIGWSGTGSVPASGTTNSVSFVLTNFSTLTWNFAWDSYVGVPSGTRVVPGSYASVFGTTGLNTLVRSSGNPRTYQMQFSAAALNGLPVGAQITELRFRLDATATAAFPISTVNWTEYDVTLSRASNSVAGMSSIFTNNMAAPVLVKSGPLTLPANRFTAGGNPNAFASLIQFDTPYVYQGGDLVMLFRHTGSDSTNTAFFDALSSSTPGYGTDFRAFSYVTFAGASGASSSVNIPQIVFNYSPSQTISFNGTALVIAGAGGPAGGGYRLLASTNISLPMSQWTPATTNRFDGSGAFRYTNAITPGSPPARFFRISLP